MQKYGALLTFCSSYIFLSLIIFSVNGDGKNVLAQPLPNSYDSSEPNTQQNDVQLIEDIINRQGEINEPEGIEAEVPTRTDSSYDDSGTVEVDSRNDYGDDEASDANNYNKAFSEEDEDAGRQREGREDSQPSSGSGGVYVVII